MGDDMHLEDTEHLIQARVLVVDDELSSGSPSSNIHVFHSRFLATAVSCHRCLGFCDFYYVPIGIWKSHLNIGSP